MVPINTIGIIKGGFDGGLFERLALTLTNHDWLGTLDPTTLAKGPGYPAFIAITNKLHLSLQVGEQISYLVGCAAIALAVWRVTGRGVAASVVYLVMAFDPINFSGVSAAVTRENFYTGPALIFIGGFFLAVHGALNRDRWWWVVPPAVVAGFVGAVFWLTREEGVWILPGLLVVAVALPLLHVYEMRRRADATFDRKTMTQSALRLGVVILLVGVTFYAPIQFVKMKNHQKYGVSLTNDFSEGAFGKAFAAWSRVRGVPLRHLVPIGEAQRLAVYPVSPAARKLQPFLEDPTNGWRLWGCPMINICDDYPGGAAPWTFRSAMFQAGLYTDEATFQAYNTRLANEINAACDKGTLRCSRKLPTSLQLADRANVRDLSKSVWYWLRQLPTTVWADQSYGPLLVNDAPRDERIEIATVIRGAPKTNRQALDAAERYANRNWPQRAIARVYPVLFQSLIAVSLLGLVVGPFRRSGRPRNFRLWALALALAGAMFARLVLFAVVDTTQYWGELRYYIAARGCLLALAAMGAVSAVDRASVARVRRRVLSSAARPALPDPA
ncbi:MAG: hypothetical protein QOF21_2962 [Actinomycetota bacterium]